MVKDNTWDELIAQCKALPANSVFFLKFTCVTCGARQTLMQPNTFFTEGQCEECGSVTNIRQRGGGLFLILATDPAGVDAIGRAAERVNQDPPAFKQREGKA